MRRGQRAAECWIRIAPDSIRSRSDVRCVSIRRAKTAHDAPVEPGPNRMSAGVSPSLGSSVGLTRASRLSGLKCPPTRDGRGQAAITIRSGPNEPKTTAVPSTPHQPAANSAASGSAQADIVSEAPAMRLAAEVSRSLDRPHKEKWAYLPRLRSCRAADETHEDRASLW
jgi:hypothetical protein